MSYSTNTNYRGIFLGYDPLSTTGSLQDQRNTVNTPVGQFVIGVNDQITETNQGLMISADGNTLTFNNNQFVDLNIDQTITGRKTFGKLKQVIPSNTGAFNEGIKISRHPTNQWSNIQFGSDPNTNTGCIDNQWLIGTSGNDAQNPLGFIIVKAGQEDGSVNYSASNTILWGANSLGTDGDFYTNGTTVFWRAHALQFDPHYQGC
ncbi:MAG: hypothetical protein EZS28_002788 [Streblomastix strix]|uniref:Uncharacterized protein n=1 Tax=Streblomastix strix TaxID=222440 RepID=A0A5J4X375_9EUKA|nr:MAG: hypothetical protein EZS28_002788 [Streblomastix strix]